MENEAMVSSVPKPQQPVRLASLDAYRGFIMVILAGGQFGIPQVAKQFPDSPVWQTLAYQFEHVAWTGCAFWDLIQPAFMFMAGAAIPFSYASRRAKGDSRGRIFAHVLLRSLILILLGVFLSSNWSKQTDWTFVNVLTQIGLGYTFVYWLRGKGLLLQSLMVLGILGGYWFLFYRHELPGPNFDYRAVHVSNDERFFFQSEGRSVKIFDRDFEWPPNPRHWDKNANFASDVDVMFLNLFRWQHPIEFEFLGQKWVSYLFYRTDRSGRPEPFHFNEGGYTTLNFVPSMVTMIFGLMAGELLRRQLSSMTKFLVLLLAGIICLLVGVLIDHTIWPDWLASGVSKLADWLGLASSPYFDRNWTLCPIVKRIWTPSWAIFSGGWTFLMLAAFYGIIDVIGWRRWAFALVVVGMNSIAMYLMGQLLKPWIRDTLQRHLGSNIFYGTYGPIVQSISILLVLWFICFWMYRKKIFIRI
jgi:predicted acyltransferase